MSLIYVLPNKVICQDAGCMGCEHSEPHTYMDCESTCAANEEGNCPGCIPVEEAKSMTTNNQQGMTGTNKKDKKLITGIAELIYTSRWSSKDDCEWNDHWCHFAELNGKCGVTGQIVAKLKRCPNDWNKAINKANQILSLISQHSASQEAEIERLKGKLGKTEYNYEMLIEEHGKLKAHSQPLIEQKARDEERKEILNTLNRIKKSSESKPDFASRVQRYMVALESGEPLEGGKG